MLWVLKRTVSMRGSFEHQKQVLKLIMLKCFAHLDLWVPKYHRPIYDLSETMKIAQHKVIQTQSLSERYSSLKNIDNFYSIVSNSETLPLSHIGLVQSINSISCIFPPKSPTEILETT